jgi:hypothetical protein
MPTSILSRCALYLALAAGLLFGGLTYRSHVYDSGHNDGVASAAAEVSAARLLVAAADSDATARANARMADDRLLLKAEHDRVTGDLKTALAASDLRATRLASRIAGLLDEAAGLRAGPPADPDRAGEAAKPAEADSSVALLIQTVNENYAICREDQARLAGLQAWYRDLARTRSQLRPSD